MWTSAVRPRPGGPREKDSPWLAASLGEIVRIYGLRHWVEQSYKQVKDELGWADFQVRSDIAIRRHQVLVNCAFSFCWDTWLTSLGVALPEPLRIRRFDDNNLIIQAVNAGLGVALCWRSLVADDLQSGRLVHLFGDSLPTNHGYHLVMPPHRLGVPKIAAFRTWLLEQGMSQQAP